MFATATVVEIDDRFTGQRFKLILAAPRTRLIDRLKKSLTAIDPETGDTIDVCVLVDPWGAIRVVIYPAGAMGMAATRGELDRGRMMEADLAALDAIDECHLVDVLADNLRRLMDRESITLEALAALANIGPQRLAEILNKQTPAAMLDEVCNLAECLGTTTEALIREIEDRGAEGWN